MIIEEIKKANTQAMKDKNQNLRNIYSVIINKYMQAQIEARLLKGEVGDEDMIRIIRKTIKELGYQPRYSWKDYLLDFKKDMETQPFAKLWGEEEDYYQLEI